MLDLSICIATLNASDYLRNCLRSICEQSSQLNWVDAAPTALGQPAEQSISSQARLNIELIIVDNNSSDDTITMLNRDFPAARLIQNDRNEGFAHPINQALHASQGQYMLLLNPDTIVLPGAINELVQYQESHPEVGICGPKVLNRYGSLQKACRRGVFRPGLHSAIFSVCQNSFRKVKSSAVTC